MSHCSQNRFSLRLSVTMICVLAILLLSHAFAQTPSVTIVNDAPFVVGGASFTASTTINMDFQCTNCTHGQRCFQWLLKPLVSGSTQGSPVSQPYQATESFPFNPTPGIYYVDWQIGWCLNGLDDLHRQDLAAPTVQFRPITVSGNLVTYECNPSSVQPPYTTYEYFVFGPSFAQQTTGTVGNFSVDYATKGKHYVVFATGIPESKTNTVCEFYNVDEQRPIAYTGRGVKAFHLQPKCEVVRATECEPVYGDSSYIRWHKTYHDFHSQSVVILVRDDDDGEIEDPMHLG